MEMKISNTSVRERTYPGYRDGETTRSLRRRVSEYNSNPRVYVNPVGETLIDNLINRRNRPYQLFRPLVEQALKDAGVEVTKMRWSQYAGCSMCPCSPGFILDEFRRKDHGKREFNVWMEVTTAE